MSEKRPLQPSCDEPATRLQICIAYDRLYPWSIGGAERWYRRLAERLAVEGHKVTYLTTRQWPIGEVPKLPGVRVVAIAQDDALYAHGRRRLMPLLRFAASLWWHLVRHGHTYNAVHTSAMSSWSVLAAGTLACFRRYRLVLDWWEVWTWGYWLRYGGPIVGTLGWLMQRMTMMLPHEAMTYSTLHAMRLGKLNRRRTVPIILSGLAPLAASDRPGPADLLVVFAGRFIPEKQVRAIIPALSVAREQLPTLQAVLIGDGPEIEAVRDAIRSAGLESSVKLPGFVHEAALADMLGRALCLVLLSQREGYGLVVVEAAARGVPSVVLRHPNSAASELIVDGVNGFICTNTDPSEVASAILRVHDAGENLRHATLAWFRANTDTLTIKGSLPHLISAYRGTSMGKRTDE